MFKALRSKIKQCFQSDNRPQRSSLEIPLLNEPDLMRAIQESDCEAVEERASRNLEQFLKDLQEEDKESGKTPLQLVAEHGDLNILKVILQAGVDDSLKGALIDHKKHVEAQLYKSSDINSYSQLDNQDKDTDCRIFYVGLFNKPNINNLGYQKYRQVLEDNYHYLKQKQEDRVISRTQNQFLNFFEHHNLHNFNNGRYRTLSESAAAKGTINLHRF